MWEIRHHVDWMTILLIDISNQQISQVLYLTGISFCSCETSDITLTEWLYSWLTFPTISFSRYSTWQEYHFLHVGHLTLHWLNDHIADWSFSPSNFPGTLPDRYIIWLMWEIWHHVRWMTILLIDISNQQIFQVPYLTSNQFMRDIRHHIDWVTILLIDISNHQIFRVPYPTGISFSSCENSDTTLTEWPYCWLTFLTNKYPRYSTWQEYHFVHVRHPTSHWLNDHIHDWHF